MNGIVAHTNDITTVLWYDADAMDHGNVAWLQASLVDAGGHPFAPWQGTATLTGERRKIGPATTASSRGVLLWAHDNRMPLVRN